MSQSNFDHWGLSLDITSFESRIRSQGCLLSMACILLCPHAIRRFDETQQTSSTADAVDDANARSLDRATTATSKYARSRKRVFHLTTSSKRRWRTTASQWQTAHARWDANTTVERTTRHTLVWYHSVLDIINNNHHNMHWTWDNLYTKRNGTSWFIIQPQFLH